MGIGGSVISPDLCWYIFSLTDIILAYLSSVGVGGWGVLVDSETPEGQVVVLPAESRAARGVTSVVGGRAVHYDTIVMRPGAKQGDHDEEG